VVTLYRLQLSQTADGQPPLVVLTLINHSINMLGDNLSRLRHDGLITRPELLVNLECPLDRGRRYNFFNKVVHGCPLLQVAGSGTSAALPTGAIDVPGFHLDHTLHNRWVRQLVPLFGKCSLVRGVGRCCRGQDSVGEKPQLLTAVKSKNPLTSTKFGGVFGLMAEAARSLKCWSRYVRKST
jgi:hypothetical protein